MDPMDIVGKSKEDVSLPKCELNSLDSDYAFFFHAFSSCLEILMQLCLSATGPWLICELSG
jgi:hypothetical protein